MSNRKCHRCVYAATDLSHVMNSLSLGWPATLTCVNCAGNPGKLTHVTPNGSCRNFRPRRKPPVRVEPPKAPNDRIRYIALTRGLFAAVSVEDYERLNKHRWYASTSGRGKVYARRNTRHGTVFMHREIMKTPPGMVVDHMDGNSLNNFQENMRNCTPQQNEHNKRPRGRKSRFKGVYPHGDKWQARIKHKGITYYLGTFDDEVEAAKARDRKAYELEGEHAYLNFPDDFPPPKRHAKPRSRKRRNW